MRPSRFFIAVLIATLALAGCGQSPSGSSASGQGKDQSSKGAQSKGQSAPGKGFRAGPTPVGADPVLRRDMPISLLAIGSVYSLNVVDVKSQVDGELVEVHFHEGQEVRKGDLLAVIDPRPFEVQLHTAEANLARDQAQLKDAQLNLVRFANLYQSKVIARQLLDTQTSTVGQLEGNISADRARIDDAKLMLTYSRITAPISGRLGLREVDPGNMIHASDPTGIVVITQMEPIGVLFMLAEDYVPQMLDAFHHGHLSIEAFDRTNRVLVATGKLLSPDNQIDPNTGTNRFKAVFLNQDRVLWPNQFLNVHVILGVKHNALAVPTSGVHHDDQGGTYAWVVRKDNTIEVRTVKAGVTEGVMTEVESGLAENELVVTDGPDSLQNGSKVDVQRSGLAGPTATTSPTGAHGPKK